LQFCDQLGEPFVMGEVGVGSRGVLEEKEEGEVVVEEGNCWGLIVLLSSWL
jgi:hypothetical protein